MGSEDQLTQQTATVVEFCPSSDEEEDDPIADTPAEGDESDPIRQEWMRAVDTVKHGLGCTLEMIREVRKDANMRAKLRAKLTGKRRNEDDSDDEGEAYLMQCKDDSEDDEGRAALGGKASTKAPPKADMASNEEDNMAGLTKSQKKRLKKKQKLQRNADAFNRLKNG